MLDLTRKYFSFEEIARALGRDRSIPSSRNEILEELIKSFWQNKFEVGDVGWDADTYFRRIFPEEYPPKPLPNFVLQGRDTEEYLSESNWEQDGGSPFSHDRKAPKLIDLRPHQGTRFSIFEPMDCDAAIETIILFSRESVVHEYRSNRVIRYEDLAEVPVKSKRRRLNAWGYSRGDLEFLKTLSLTKRGLRKWCGLFGIVCESVEV